MPQKQLTLAEHRDNGEWLRLRCHDCVRDKVISMWEACHRYGHDFTVPEVRTVIMARCKSNPCRAGIGIALREDRPRGAGT